MNTLEHRFHGRLRGPVVVEDAKGFLRPDDLAGGDVPAEAARMTQPLRFCPVRLLALLGTLAGGADAGGILQSRRAQQRVFVILGRHWRSPVSSPAPSVPRTCARHLAEYGAPLRGGYCWQEGGAAIWRCP